MTHGKLTLKGSYCFLVIKLTLHHLDARASADPPGPQGEYLTSVSASVCHCPATGLLRVSQTTGRKGWVLQGLPFPRLGTQPKPTAT